jgi:hypothetical protein
MSTSKLVRLLIIMIIQFIATNSNPCRILALEAGGDRGAYQAGAIKGLIDNLPASDVQWDIVSGVSAGALNGLGFSLFAKGEEKEASDFVINTWLNMKGKSDVFQNWNILGPAYSLFWEESLYDTSPLRNMITSILKGKTLKRGFNFGATSLTTGKYIRFQNLTLDEATDAVMASSAVPGIFPPITFRNDTFVDGGASYFFDLTSAIEMCIAKGFPESEIVIDLVLCVGTGRPVLRKLTTIEVFYQSATILNNNFLSRDLQSVAEDYPEVRIRHLIEPSKPFAELVPLEFEPAAIRGMIKDGEDDSKRVIKKGLQALIRNFIQKHKNLR